MNIIIERILEKQYRLEKQDWNRRTLKLIIGLLIVVAIEIFTVFKRCIANHTNNNQLDFSVVFAAILGTFSLTILFVIYATRYHKFKYNREKIRRNLAYPTTIKLSDIDASVINPDCTIIYKWEYFQYYYIKRNNLYIAKSKQLGITISLDELNITEQNELVEVLERKRIKRILY